MKIYFSPEYSGIVYVKPTNGSSVMMDTVVVNTVGLVNMLELRLGLHYEDMPEQERMARYYDSVCKYMEANPGNIMEASFATSGLGTAKAMLQWREELRSAEWDFEGEEISRRLAVLVGVEEYFRKQSGCDMAGRLHIVTDQVGSQKLDCSDLEIELCIDKNCLKPSVKSLITVLENNGAKVKVAAGAEDSDNNLSKVRRLIASASNEKITLDKDDDSIVIWKFPDDRSAYEYLAYRDMDEVDVWINANNKQMDNWLMLMDQPMTGSVTAGCTPQLTQLFVMGLGMFANPLNVNTLIEWLNMPVHPISGYFRSQLAAAIVKEGGYRNAKCRQMVKDYIEGEYVFLDQEQKKLPEEDQKKIRLADRKKRLAKAEVFLPSLERTDEIKTEKVKTFVLELSSWARQRALLMAERSGSEQWIEQLGAVAGMADAFYILLCTVKDETIDYKVIDSWMSTIYQKGSYTNAVAEVGCRTVVDSPSKIASVSEMTVWIGVDGDASRAQECAFLYPSEKQKLIDGLCMHPWEDACQNSYNEQMMLTPLKMTSDQLVLVVRERIGGENTLKHPLVVRLEQQITNLDDFVICPSIPKEERHMTDLLSRTGADPQMKIKFADKIQWPDHLSPTTIATLAEYPLDYVMEQILGIANDGKAQMADVKTTKGNVAHAVIEALFAPRDGNRISTASEIQSRIDSEYESVYAEVVEAKGAIMQLAENQLSEKLLHEQLRSCLDTLLEILSENELVVVGCEKRVEAKLGLGLPQATDKDGNVLDRDMTGFIDMTLEDKDGKLVVFDFKWTSSVKSYKNRLSENRSSQLELYKWMLTDDETRKGTGKCVDRVAYFLMPDAHLYSQDAFIGKNCTKIDPENFNNIVDQLKQSVIYRKNQIEGGVIETVGEFASLDYVKNTEAKGLFPLKGVEEQDAKEPSFFSNYTIFLG